MSFIKPRFQSTVVFEAILTTKDVQAYMEIHGCDKEEAIEVLGKEYVAKYGNYCQVGSSGLEIIQD